MVGAKAGPKGLRGEKTALAGLRPEIAVGPKMPSAGQGVDHRAVEPQAFPHREIGILILLGGGDGLASRGIEHHQIGIGADGQGPPFAAIDEDLGGVGRGQGNELFGAEMAAGHAQMPQNIHPILDSAAAIGNLGEIGDAETLLGAG